MGRAIRPASRPPGCAGGAPAAAASRVPRARAPAAPSRTGLMNDMDLATRTELEAAAFRRLVEHLRGRTDVQNIDLMNLAGFCRNCLSKWYRAAAEERGVALSDPDARGVVYGMPYKEWQARFQREATPEQQGRFGGGAASRQH